MLVQEPINIMGVSDVLIYDQAVPYAREVALSQLVMDAVNLLGTLPLTMSPGTCPASKYVGQTANISINAKGGTAPYSFTVTKKVGTGTPVTIGTYSNVPENGTVNISYVLVAADVGSVLFSVAGQDSCPSGAKPISDSCTINVITCATGACTITIT